MRVGWSGHHAWTMQLRVVDRLAEHYDLHLQKKDDRIAALEAINLATLLANANSDESAAAQTVLLYLQDKLAAQDPSAEVSAKNPSTNIPEQRDASSAIREMRRQRSRAGGAKKGHSKKKRKRR